MIGLPPERIRKYPGIKEDVYVPDFKPDLSIKTKLGIDDENIVVTIRPPATEAHYHNPESEKLFKAAINMLTPIPSVRMVLLPRNEKQGKSIKKSWPELYKEKKIIIPDKVIDGLNLIWNSDLVISGGGTMNREAAALNVPLYSIFRGNIGKVDRYLEKNNRLVLLESVDDVNSKIVVKRRNKDFKSNEKSYTTLDSIVNTIDNLVKSI